MEDITYADYEQLKSFCSKEFWRISWFVCLKRDIISSSCIWELSNCLPWNIWTCSYTFFYCNSSSKASSRKKYKSKIRSINWYWYIINDKKGIKGGICNSIFRYSKANKKYIKDYDKIKESSYINDWDVNNSYGWKMSQKLPVNSFKWVEETFEFNEYFIKGYNEESDERYFLEVDIQYSEKLHDLHKDLP